MMNGGAAGERLDACRWTSDVRHVWSSLTPRQRRIWLAAGLWSILHLLSFGIAILVAVEFTPDELRGWSDVVAYRDAGNAYRERVSLYELDAWEDPMTYYYHPVFAMAASWVSRAPFRAGAFVWFVLQAAAYLGALAVWYRVLQALGLDTLAAGFVRWLPLALVFTEWFVNLVYGNLTSTLLLLSGLLALQLIRGYPGRSAWVALPILLVKPQWLFPLILPLLMRRWRILIVSVGLLLGGYLAINALYILIAGPHYGVETLRDYATFLTTLSSHYTWGGHTHSFENFNHSWQQILISYWGAQAWVPALATAFKLALVLPVGVFIGLVWHTPHALRRRPQIALWVTGLSYLAAMAFLAQLWEVLGSLIFFMAAQGISQTGLRRWSWLYLVYALYELPALVGFMVGWDWLILPQSTPLTMLALLFLYGLLAALVYRDLAQVRSHSEGIPA